MLSGILSDTLNLNSPTTTEIDELAPDDEDRLYLMNDLLHLLQNLMNCL